MGQTNNGPLALILLVASLLVFLAMSAVSVAEGESPSAGKHYLRIEALR